MTDLIFTTITAARESLIEARRYVTVNPEECESLVKQAVVMLQAVQHKPGDETLYRIRGNFNAGLNAILCDPDVMKGYLTGAIHELGAMRGPIKAGADTT